MPDISQGEPLIWFGLTLMGIALRLLQRARRPLSPEQAAQLLEALRQERLRRLRDAAALDDRHARGTLAEPEYAATRRDYQRQLIEITRLCNRLSLTSAS